MRKVGRFDQNESNFGLIDVQNDKLRYEATTINPI